MSSTIPSAWPADAVARRSVDKLIPYARNARLHSPAQVDQIAGSIREFGWTVPVLVDEDDGLIAGHGRVLAAQQLGIAEIPVMVARGWSEAQKRAYVLADNKLTLNGEWDEELLKVEIGDLAALGFDLALTGFSDDELANMIAEAVTGQTDPDETPELPADPITVLGDVWVLGRHRIVCGDCTDPTAWDRLNVADGFICFSSPPYNVGDASGLRDRYKPGVPKTNKFYTDYADDKAPDEYAQLLNDAMTAAFMVCDTVVFNLQPLAGSKRPLLRWLDEHSTHLVDIITWDKGRGAPHIQPGIMSSRFEWIIVMSSKTNATRVIPHSSWQGKFSNVYQAPPQSENKFASHHGATFPVHLPEFVVGDLMNRCRGVVDCFLGTGTTVIAAEKLGREGRGIELSPAYVDVAVKRWQDFTGQKAILESTGRSFDEMADERLHRPRRADRPRRGALS
jgi:DNA modification methylase